MQVIALRYFNPVGAHSSGLNGEVPNGVPNNLVPFITQTAIGKRESLTIFGDDYDTRDGTCVRDYVHVSDIALAHVQALRFLFEGKSKQPMEAINLGTGNGVSVKECVEGFERANDIKLAYTFGPRREGDVVAVYADPSKAARLLGWKATRDLDEMMRSAWVWEQHLQKEG
jgi:UDP-glucose 4-epimerase